jgi:hypothetical protein
MRPQYARSGAGNDSTVSRPQAWLTPAQREHSENFIGSPTQRRLADDIREAERIGSDGMVRAQPGLSISYQAALAMLGMDEE